MVLTMEMVILTFWKDIIVQNRVSKCTLLMNFSILSNVYKEYAKYCNIICCRVMGYDILYIMEPHKKTIRGDVLCDKKRD